MALEYISVLRDPLVACSDDIYANANSTQCKDVAVSVSFLAEKDVLMTPRIEGVRVHCCRLMVGSLMSMATTRRPLLSIISVHNMAQASRPVKLDVDGTP
jgi:hypothetical protein